MLPTHFRWTVVQSVPRGTPDKLQQFRFYLHVCDSRHFRSIRNFFFVFFLQNGRRRPFCMTENHFWSHFSSFYTNTPLLFVLNFSHKMAAGDHFGWPKITFDRISRHFRSIRNFRFKKSQNGRWRPFWMTENHFWSHFSPFHINTQLSISQNDTRQPFWMTENYFRSHFPPFQINTQILFIEFFSQNTENHFRSHFSPFQINTQFFF